eukprot:220086_1
MRINKCMMVEYLWNIKEMGQMYQSGVSLGFQTNAMCHMKPMIQSEHVMNDTNSLGIVHTHGSAIGNYGMNGNYALQTGMNEKQMQMGSHKTNAENTAMVRLNEMQNELNQMKNQMNTNMMYSKDWRPQNGMNNEFMMQKMENEMAEMRMRLHEMEKMKARKQGKQEEERMNMISQRGLGVGLPYPSEQQRHQGMGYYGCHMDKIANGHVRN